ncbi:hypothetical protein [Mycobacteroides abscessus]|uniref:hypothetical protein n=1 Tax=Mycobacteroides abscessus TaxID=36809 RepID=UPI002102EE0B|nr:hypothetical protein [Mycobacteroides abscessus]
MNRYLSLFLTDGAPDPLAGHTTGSHATISVDGLITVNGADSSDWRLIADARWQTRRVYPTPWAVAAITPADELLVLNLARVSVHALPAAIVRSLHLQAQQFCSTPQHQWVKSAQTKCHLSADSRLIIGSHAIAILQPLSTPEDIFGTELGKTYHDLSPKRRQIALLLDSTGGMTIPELARHFAGNSPTPAKLRAAKISMYTELSRMRQHPNISISQDRDGRYTIRRINQEQSAETAIAR